MTVRTTGDQREKVRDAVVQRNAAWNEVVWTYLVADVAARDATRTRPLFGLHVPIAETWFEAKPLPPRQSEGNTRIDLAAGAIRQRGETASGIEFDRSCERSWVGFVEAKVLSDCSVDVEHDHLRNQLIRVIENLLCFQSEGQHPEHLVFSILTPEHFRQPKHRKSRLYGYKFMEYARDKDALLDDLNLCEQKPRAHANWTYPVVRDRIERLTLHWASYEEILSGDPDLAGIDVYRCAASGELPKQVRDRLLSILPDHV